LLVFAATMLLNRVKEPLLAVEGIDKHAPYSEVEIWAK
jgi:hypothetical protein